MKVKYTLLAEFQETTATSKLWVPRLHRQFSNEIENKAPVESLDRSAGKPIAGLPKISAKM